MLVMKADTDGATRRVPLLAAADARIVPGLAVSAMRVLGRASTVMIDGVPGALTVADRRIPLPHDGMLRLITPDPRRHAARTVPASSLDDPTAARKLAGKLVLLGSTAPESGALRVGIGGAPMASVHLHADAIEQLLAGAAPNARAAVILAEWLAIALASTGGHCRPARACRRSPARWRRRSASRSLIIAVLLFYGATFELIDPVRHLDDGARRFRRVSASHRREYARDAPPRSASDSSSIWRRRSCNASSTAPTR